jgi:hypothetical protein
LNPIAAPNPNWNATLAQANQVAAACEKETNSTATVMVQASNNQIVTLDQLSSPPDPNGSYLYYVSVNGSLLNVGQEIEDVNNAATGVQKAVQLASDIGGNVQGNLVNYLLNSGASVPAPW